MRAKVQLRILLFQFVIVSTLWAFTGLSRADPFVGVRWVDDGDTIVLSDGRRVRYIGINAPEVARKDKSAERFGSEARDFNKKLVYRNEVRLEFDEERFDRYNRLLAYVFLRDGTFVNAELVKSGLAHCLFRKPNKRYDSALLAFQRKAMTNRVGMWGSFRDSKEAVLGNRLSKRFHSMTCPFGSTMKPDHRIIFKTRYDAFWSGYSPCKRCEGGGGGAAEQ